MSVRSVKVVVTGPRRSGTTSFIRAVSEITVLTTERKVATPGEGRGEKVVAMDFGRVSLGGETVLYLFGTPGDDPAALAGGTFADGLIGLVVMVDTTRKISMEEGAELVAYLRTNSDAPWVLAANKLADATPVAIADLRHKLGVPDDVPVIPCQAPLRETVTPVLVSLARRILETMPEA